MSLLSCFYLLLSVSAFLLLLCWSKIRLQSISVCRCPIYRFTLAVTWVWIPAVVFLLHVPPPHLSPPVSPNQIQATKPKRLNFWLLTPLSTVTNCSRAHYRLISHNAFPLCCEDVRHTNISLCLSGCSTLLLIILLQCIDENDTNL